MASTNRQYRDSMAFFMYAALGLFTLMLIMSIFNGCTTTKKCCDKEHVITEWDGDRQINWYTCKNESYGSKGTNKTTARRK